MRITATSILPSLLAGVIACAGAWTPALAQDRDLTKLSLEDLLSTEVTSVAKRPQRVDEAAAAVFVVSQEDIRRSGASTIPDILRMVPGMEVGQMHGGGAAVSARGFNGLSANKLLVLVDGRAIYLSALGGVFWDQQLVPLEDIQRIEIVRGPGATLWGANAVNGVINIVTKHSVDTLGLAISAQGDSQSGDRLFGQFGAQLGTSTTFRAYGSDHTTRGQIEGFGGLIDDIYTGFQGGARLDTAPSDRDAITIQADYQRGHDRLTGATAGVTLPPGLLPTALPAWSNFDGDNLVARWTRTLDARTGFSLQVYRDHVHGQRYGVDGDVVQADVDFSHHFDLGPRNAIIWGVGYRQTSDKVTGNGVLSLTPDHRTDAWYGAYVEDDVTVIPDRLSVTVGAKFEHNAYSGFQFQPSIRAIWIGDGWSIWGAASRATRTPSRYETDLTITSPYVMQLPNDVGSETMEAYEIGWRARLRPSVALDVTGYHQVYKHLISWGLAGFASPGIPVFQYGNNGDGQNTGVEAALDLAVTPKWSIKVAADLLSLRIRPGGVNSINSGNSIDENASPHAQLSVRSLWNVSDTVELDLWYRRVGKLNTGPIAAYSDLDVHLTWRPTAHLEVSLVGENLLSRGRTEFFDPGDRTPAIVARRALIKLTAKY